MIERLPARVRTPAVARAATAPSSILLAGAGASLAVLGGVPLAAAALVGAAVWAGRVALAAPRRRGERIDPFAVGEPWRHFVREALQARARFEQTAHRARGGPLRDRLADMATRLDHGVEECWRIARQGQALESALRQLDRGDIERELDAVRADRAAAVGDDERASLERAEQAVLGQQASAERIATVARDARSRLRALNAQLDEAVARGLELSLRTREAVDLGPLSQDVDTLVGELESLRQALEETGGPPGAMPGTGP